MKGKLFVSGLVTGTILGSVAGMVLDPLKDKQKKRICKGTDGIFKSIGGVIDNIMMK